MADNGLSDDARIIAAAYADRVTELFKVFAEAVATGEPDREAVVRFKRRFDVGTARARSGVGGGEGGGRTLDASFVDRQRQDHAELRQAAGRSRPPRR